MSSLTPATEKRDLSALARATSNGSNPGGHIHPALLEANDMTEVSAVVVVAMIGNDFMAALFSRMTSGVG